jgi:hypothetical protein
LLAGWFVNDGPEAAEDFKSFGEFTKIDRFDDVGVAAELVAAAEVGLFARGSEHDDGEMSEAWIGADFAEDFDAVDLGEFYIEENDDGLVMLAVRVGAAAV